MAGPRWQAAERKESRSRRGCRAPASANHHCPILLLRLLLWRSSQFRRHRRICQSPLPLRTSTLASNGSCIRQRAAGRERRDAQGMRWGVPHPAARPHRVAQVSVACAISLHYGRYQGRGAEVRGAALNAHGGDLSESEVEVLLAEYRHVAQDTRSFPREHTKERWRWLWRERRMAATSTGGCEPPVTRRARQVLRRATSGNARCRSRSCHGKPQKKLSTRFTVSATESGLAGLLTVAAQSEARPLLAPDPVENAHNDGGTECPADK